MGKTQKERVKGEKKRERIRESERERERVGRGEERRMRGRGSNVTKRRATSSGGCRSCSAFRRFRIDPPVESATKSWYTFLIGRHCW